MGLVVRRWPLAGTRPASARKGRGVEARVRILLPSGHSIVRERSHPEPSDVCAVQPCGAVPCGQVPTEHARERALDVEWEEDVEEHWQFADDV